MTHCDGWNVYAGSCVLVKGHKGPHEDAHGEAFRATPRHQTLPAPTILTVRVVLTVRVDTAAYREAYGDESASDIRESVRHGAADGLSATIHDGILSVDVR